MRMKSWKMFLKIILNKKNNNKKNENYLIAKKIKRGWNLKRF